MEILYNVILKMNILFLIGNEWKKEKYLVKFG